MSTYQDRLLQAQIDAAVADAEARDTAIAQGEAARERHLAAERARHGIRTYHSDALGAVTIPED